MSEKKQKHPTHVERYTGSLEDLARDVKNMRYDKLTEFLCYLAAQVKSEADKDMANGKPRLASKLYLASNYLSRSQEEIDSAWKISEPYMK